MEFRGQDIYWGVPRGGYLRKGEEGSRRCRRRTQAKYKPTNSLAEAMTRPGTRMTF